MYEYYGAYNCYGLERQVSGFITVSHRVVYMSHSQLLDLWAEEAVS